MAMLTRLLVLWLLSERPQYGYQIQQTLSDRTMSFWFPLDAASIYSSLKTLNRVQFIEEHAVEQVDRRPTRTVYRITGGGREELNRLLERAWAELPSPACAFNAALAARPELPESRVADLLHERLHALRARRNELNYQQRAAPAAAMTDRQRALTDAEITWLHRYLREEFPDHPIAESKHGES